MDRDKVLREFERRETPFTSREDLLADEVLRLRELAGIQRDMGVQRERQLSHEMQKLRDELNYARGLLIDLKRYRDEAARLKPLQEAVAAYVYSGGTYVTWLALRQFVPEKTAVLDTACVVDDALEY